VHSPEELKLVVTASSRVGMLPEVQEDMIHRALELADVTVREIMVPRPTSSRSQPTCLWKKRWGASSKSSIRASRL